MTAQAPALLVVLAAALVSGCGTTDALYKSTFPGNKLEPYGGVKDDVDRVREVKSPEWSAWNRQELNRAFDAFGTVLVVAFDLPFSFVGDTLMLPFAFGPPTHYPDSNSEKQPALQSNGAGAPPAGHPLTPTPAP